MDFYQSSDQTINFSSFLIYKVIHHVRKIKKLFNKKIMISNNLSFAFFKIIKKYFVCVHGYKI